MQLIDVQRRAWQAVNEIPFNPETAFVKLWLERKAGYAGALGVPVADEVGVEEGGTAQPFSSGVVLHWTGSAVEVI